MPDKLIKITLPRDLYNRASACRAQCYSRSRHFTPVMPMDQFICLLVEYALDCYDVEIDLESRCNDAE